MPWAEYSDVDDVISDWIKSLYTPYRTALTDPTVLPTEDMIDWDAYWAGAHTTSFIVYEEFTTHKNLGLGVKTVELDGIQVVRVTYRWIMAGKPPELKKIREFLTKTLHANVSPLPSALTNAGIRQMIPIESRMIVERDQTAQQDFWTLSVRLATKVLNDTV